MSTEKIFEQITSNDLKTNGVSALALRPNQPSQYGLGSLSGKELQQHFDKLAKLVIEKYNKMAGVLSGDSVTEYFQIPEEYRNALVGDTIGDLLKYLLDTEGNIQYKDNTGKLTPISTDLSSLRNDLQRLLERAAAGEFKGDQGEKGEAGMGFRIAKTYDSVEQMNNDYSNPDILEGNFVLITGLGVEEHGYLYVKTNTRFDFVVDMSGATGIPGQDGKDGKNGLSAYELYKQQHPSYTGTPDEWLASLKGDKGETGMGFKIAAEFESIAEMESYKYDSSILDGEFVLIHAKNPDGTTNVNDPDNAKLFLKVHNGFEYVNDLSGMPGIGKDGKDGATPEIKNNYWYINGDPTGVKAIGTDGLPGLNGVDGKSAYELALESGKFEGTLDQWLSYITSSTEQISTISGEDFRLFVGTQEEYDALSEQDRKNLFAIISDDSSVVQLDAATSGTTYGLEYDYYKIGSPYKIVKGIGTATAMDIVIPAKSNGYPVKTIYTGAFQNNTNITSVKLPSGITEIGEYAFAGCTNLRLINIPATVTTIGRLAFSGCPNLTIVCESDSNGANWDRTWSEGVFNVIYGETNVDVAKSARAIDADYAWRDVEGNVISETYATIESLEEGNLVVGKSTIATSLAPVSSRTWTTGTIDNSGSYPSVTFPALSDGLYGVMYVVNNTAYSDIVLLAQPSGVNGGYVEVLGSKVSVYQNTFFFNELVNTTMTVCKLIKLM
jgi:hypothetical protein